MYCVVKCYTLWSFTTVNIKLQHFSSAYYSHKEIGTHKSLFGGKSCCLLRLSPVSVSLCCRGIKTALELLEESRLKILHRRMMIQQNQHGECGFKGLYRVLHFLSNGTEEKIDDADKGKDRCCRRVKLIPVTMGLR